MPIQVAFLQGTVPFESDVLFPRLLDMLTLLPMWSVNLGELRFSEEQCARLAEALRASGVTHMFYECTVAGSWKDEFREIIRENRQKHGFWKFGPDAEQNRVILSAVKSWFVPTSHKSNKRWVARFRHGWRNVDRVQCEACSKWRRLAPGQTSWPRNFYCCENTWDARFADCRAPEEDFERATPVKGDLIVCELAPHLWLEGTLDGTPPKKEAWPTMPRLHMPAAPVYTPSRASRPPLRRWGGKIRRRGRRQRSCSSRRASASGRSCATRRRRRPNVLRRFGWSKRRRRRSERRVSRCASSTTLTRAMRLDEGGVASSGACRTSGRRSPSCARGPAGRPTSPRPRGAQD